MVSAPAGALAAPRLAIVHAARPQLAVMSGQFAAGVGNLVYAAVLARVLDPGDYSQVVAFLALYVLMHVPAAAFSAAGALAPDRIDRLVPRLGAIGAAMAIALAATSGWIADLSGVDRPLVLGLAAAAPAAALLGVRRGVAYGHEQLGRVTASLVTEPAVRLGVGVVLAAVAGPVGAVVGTVLAGYAALAVCWTARTRPAGRRAAVPSRVAATAGGSFVLMAVLQSLDLLVATRVLDDDGAARFAVLSTLGGAAFFATATIPLVLMPAAVRGRPHAAPTALALTAGVGLGVAAAGAILARPLLGATFGEEYSDVAHLVGPYLLAMALLGVVRVEVARFAAERDTVAVTRAGIAIAGAVAVELLGLGAFGTHVGAFVAVTLLTSTALAVVIELPALLVPRRSLPVMIHPPRTDILRDRSVQAMAGLCVVAAVVRVATTRGLWVDEAISVSQAQLPLGEMLADVRTTDVHPPLHHVLLWFTVRIFGTSEAAVRLPSLIAGVALVPAMAWVGRVVYDRRTGWIAAVFAVVAPFGVWYSQEARMYSIFMLLAALAVGAQVQALRTGAMRHWVLYGLLTAAMMWTQYFAVLPIAVQTVVTAYVIWRDRHDAGRRRQLLLGAAAAIGMVVVVLAPMVPILRDQLAAYGNRGAGLTPGQAGAGSSTIGGTISVYAVGANLIWATLGYHADGVMVQVAALVATADAPGAGDAGPWAVGPQHAAGRARRRADGRPVRDRLDEARPVRAALLRRRRTGDAAARRPRRHRDDRAPCPAAAGIDGGHRSARRRARRPAAQRREPSALRLPGGLRRDRSQRAEPGDVVLYEPSYLAEVVGYYAPGVDARPVGSTLDDDTGTVFVLATERVAQRRGHVGPPSATSSRDLDQRRATSSTSSTGRTSVSGSCSDRPARHPRRLPVRAGRVGCRRPGRGSRWRATRARRRQHGRARPLLLVVAAARAHRQPGAVRRAHHRRAVQRRAGAGLLVDLPRPAAATACVSRRCRSAPSTSTCSSRPTASRSMSSRPRSPPRRGCAGVRVHVALLDDGNREEMAELAHRHGVRYVRRTLHVGAKAGNINHALGRTQSPFVLVLDCDHVPHPDLLARTLPEFVDEAVAFVQTPQYYANAPYNRIAEASWRQQALFFGPIARGKDSHGSMFCCGTNVIFRREALAAVGGFPTGSLTEDFALSVDLHERGWRSAYVPEVLASGLGPEDMASYVSQQHRWARGCLGMIPRVIGSTLPLARKMQYLLSASYFLSGWTVLVYLSMPIVRILTGAQPLAGAAADSFLAAFGPYFVLSLATVASVGAGYYTFSAYSLATSTFWIHIDATYRVVARRTGSFVVTPKVGDSGRQFRPAMPTVVVIAVLVGAALYGLAHGRDAATLNNVAFAALHVSILGHGIAAAVAPRWSAVATPAADRDTEAAAADVA